MALGRIVPQVPCLLNKVDPYAQISYVILIYRLVVGED
jgi:hypothetical protein